MQQLIASCKASAHATLLQRTFACDHYAVMLVRAAWQLVGALHYGMLVLRLDFCEGCAFTIAVSVQSIVAS